MKYYDHIPFFKRELDRLGSPGFPGLSFQSIVQVLARAPTPEADAACRQFVATLSWPPLTDELRLELCVRLACALEWVQGMKEVDVPADETGHDFLRDLLIPYFPDAQPKWLYKKIVEPNDY